MFGNQGEGMLNVSEVRVGNWVIKITGKDLNTKSFFEYKPIAIDETYFTYAKSCFPIKLTAEVLEQSVFVFQNGDWHNVLSSDPETPFLVCRQQDRSWYLKEMKIPYQPIYLHQLQNLFFAMSNEELTVNLAHFQNIDLVGPINFFAKPPQSRATADML